MASADEKQVCVGVISGVHGVKGAIVVKPFTERPDDVAAYGPVFIHSGRKSLTLRITGRKKAGLIVNVDGVDDRSSADKLKGEKLYVARARLPEPEDDSWYITDLAGLDVEDEGGRKIGSVVTVQNYGAGDLLEVRPPGKGGATMFLPFTKAVIISVDLQSRRIVVKPPEDLPEQDLPGQDLPGQD